ncbi:MAG: hypothetical protein QXR44_00950 [Thermoproteota archaeon]
MGFKKFLNPIFTSESEDSEPYEIITPIVTEIITAGAIYNNLYNTFYDISKRDYNYVSSILKDCLKENLNGKDIEKVLKNSLRKNKLLDIIDQTLTINIRTMSSEEALTFLRILESKARRKYQEYTLKLNSLISIFFFYVFLVPTPIVLFSEFLPQASYVLLPIFFISNILIFRLFFNRISKIKGALLG